MEICQHQHDIEVGGDHELSEKARPVVNILVQGMPDKLEPLRGSTKHKE
jgi:hypothetical protein